ncbi:MAG: hypothetical protein GYB68_12075 [Chloroflexi bacterium]|nr:hypothetical protein [Chloroflexota bacterium]
MKLAEALIQRADLQQTIAQMRNRLAQNARVQEGDAPNEDPQELLASMRRAIADLVSLIQRINRTNIQTAFDETRSITDALAERDALMMERQALAGLVQAAAVQQNRYSLTEIRMVPTVDVAAFQAEVDDLSRRYRELDTQIQALNWATDLLD